MTIDVFGMLALKVLLAIVLSECLVFSINVPFVLLAKVIMGFRNRYVKK